jgi:hypothetical protein
MGARSSSTAADGNDSGESEGPLGSVWNEVEAACHGVWTRVADTSTFSADWADCNVTATLVITITGVQVSVTRTSSSDGNDCNYVGTLSGNSVAGTYSCTISNPLARTWSATITE